MVINRLAALEILGTDGERDQGYDGLFVFSLPGSGTLPISVRRGADRGGNDHGKASKRPREKAVAVLFPRVKSQGWLLNRSQPFLLGM